tara:strand:- start:2881 stop:3438 length:558 start_codon:yes stop_codon:yes gene_type:complete
MTKYKQYHLYTDLGDIMVNLTMYGERTESVPDAAGCLNWIGPFHNQGYGFIGAIRKRDDKRIMVVAHRVGARLKLGRGIDVKEAVVHSCGNPRCQNPQHLMLGDLKLRSQTMIKLGKWVPGKKEAGVTRRQNRDYKYSDADIQYFRSHSPKEISQQYNLTNDRAAQARWYARTSFKWLPFPEETT